MKRKKILAISYLFPNPEQMNHGIFVFNRLKAMSQYADIVVINPLPIFPPLKSTERYKTLAKVPEHYDMDGIKVYYPKFLSIPKVLKNIEVGSYFKAVMRVIEQQGLEFDLIDLHWTFPDLPTGYRLSKKYKVPFNLTLRGMEAFHIHDGGSRQKIVAKYIKHANKIISLSQEMADTADSIANTANRTTVIRNGVNSDKFYYLPKSECREKLGLDENDFIILGVGALVYRKGFDVVIKALAKFKQSNSIGNIKFVVVGAKGAEGDYQQELNDLVMKNELQSHVQFAGAVPNSDLIYWYNAVDVFCLSSRGEGSPNVLTEALACGTPAISTAVGSAPEIMESEDNLGIVIPSQDEDALAHAIKSMSTQTFERKLNASHFGKYTWDWCAQRVMQVINS